MLRSSLRWLLLLPVLLATAACDDRPFATSELRERIDQLDQIRPETITEFAKWSRANGVELERDLLPELVESSEPERKMVLARAIAATGDSTLLRSVVEYYRGNADEPGRSSALLVAGAARVLFLADQARYAPPPPELLQAFAATLADTAATVGAPFNTLGRYSWAAINAYTDGQVEADLLLRGAGASSTPLELRDLALDWYATNRSRLIWDPAAFSFVVRIGS